MRKLLFGAIIALMATVSTLIVTPAVYADSASDYCRTQFSNTSSPEFKACTTGYLRGNHSMPICANEFTQPVPIGNGFAEPEDLKNACVKGYSQYTKDANACNDKYKDDAQQASDCRKTLRPNQPDPIAADPDVDNTATLEPGAIPASGEINKLRAEEKSEHLQCGIEGFLGRLTCDVTMTMTRIADTSFSLLTIFLKTPTLSVLGSGNQQTSVYEAWVQIRNVANVGFAIAFMIVVYSQLTGLGLSNYGIKKIVPRMILTAFLLNLSFFICAIIVDLSNVLGGTLTTTLTSIVPPEPKNGSTFSGWETATGSVLLISGAAIAAGTALLFVDLAMIIPLLVGALIAVVITLLMLVARQALIIIFIIISPLAMMALLLPGTKKWFDKWRSLFVPIVMLYPAIALVYGGSHIASVIIQRIGAAQGEVMLTIFGMAIAIVPLAATPFLMQLGGGLMSKYAGVAKGSGLVGKVRKRTDEYAKYRGNLRTTAALSRTEGSKMQKAMKLRDGAMKYRLNRGAQRKTLNDTYEGVSEDYALEVATGSPDEQPSTFERLKEAATEGKYTARTKSEKYQQELAQSKDPDAMANARARSIQTNATAHAKKVKAQALALERAGVSGSEQQNIAEGKPATPGGQQPTAAQQEAAILRIAQMGDAGGILSIMKSGTLNASQLRTLASNSQGGGTIAKLPFLSHPEVIENIKQGVVTQANFTQTVVKPAIADGGWSPEEMTTIDKGGALEIIKAVEEIESHVEPQQRQPNETHNEHMDRLQHDADLKQGAADIRLAAFAALSTDRVNSNITGARDELHILARPHIEKEAHAVNRDIDHSGALVQNRLYDMEQADRARTFVHDKDAAHAAALREEAQRSQTSGGAAP